MMQQYLYLAPTISVDKGKAVCILGKISASSSERIVIYPYIYHRDRCGGLRPLISSFHREFVLLSLGFSIFILRVLYQLQPASLEMSATDFVERSVIEVILSKQPISVITLIFTVAMLIPYLYAYFVSIGNFKMMLILKKHGELSRISSEFK